MPAQQAIKESPPAQLEPGGDFCMCSVILRREMFKICSVNENAAIWQHDHFRYWSDTVLIQIIQSQQSYLSALLTFKQLACEASE